MKLFAYKMLFPFLKLLNKIFFKKNRVIIMANDSLFICNPKYIYLYLNSHYPKLDVFYVSNKNDKKNVKINSFRFFYILSTASIWIDNSLCFQNYFKFKNQTYIQTWHGDRGFKKILFDNDLRKKYKNNDFNKIDYMISGSNFFNKIIKSAFKFNGPILEVGCPRNDILFDDSIDTTKVISEKLHIDTSAKILLYAPTYRDNQEEYEEQFDISSFIKILSDLTSEKWICYFKPHPLDKRKYFYLSDNIKILEKNIDIQEYLRIIDFLISDYSSIVCDFYIRKKPYLILNYDLEKYVQDCRQLYFKLEDSPFVILNENKNYEDMIKYILNVNWEKKYTELNEFYGTFENGEASKKLCHFINEKCQNK